MKRTQKTYLLRTIKKNIVSFLAVALMVATGISIYLGDFSAAKAILERANDYFIENKLQSLEVSSIYGITDEDINAMAMLSEVDEVEGGYSSVVLLDADNGTGKMLVKAQSLLDTMNLPVVLEGTLPENYKEVAIEQKMAQKEGIQVGDTITIEHNGELRATTFKVSAIINQPSFCCAKALDSRGMSDIGIGSVQYYISLPKEAFLSSYFADCYTTAYIKNYELDNYFYFSDEYREKEAALQEKLMTLGAERASLRLEKVHLQGKKKIQETEAILEEYESTMQSAKEQVAELLGIEKGISQWDEVREQLKNAGKFEKYYLKIVDEVEKAEDNLTEAGKQLEESKKEIEEAEPEEWVVSIRNDIGDIRSVDIIVEGLYGLGYSMALIFVFVSVIVCYSAISRMINEQRARIGMQKALGFSTKEIMRHYMRYSIICGLCGVLEGWTASVLSVQTLSLMIYKDVFLLGKIPHSFDGKQAVLISVFFMIVFMAASFFACKKEIAMPATELLRGEVPEREKPFAFEKMGAYQKLKLYNRTMIKNVLGDKPRMLTTIIGVAGCMVLLVISFTMLITMEESTKLQFEKYFLYENRMVVDGDKADFEEFEDILKKENVEYIRIQDKLKLYREESGNWQGAHLVVVSDLEEIKNFMVLENPDTRREVEIPKDGMLVSLKCAQNHNLKNGSVLEVMGNDGNVRKITAQGVIEHYLGYNLFVVSDSYYEKVMGEEADRCVFLLKGNVDGLYEKVKHREGFLSIRDNSEYQNMGNALVMVVMICFVFAAIMAVLVMLNQNVMHISRKAKELSVMRINGFTLKETENFVSRDNFMLTAMGIILGWIVGAGFGYVVTLVLEVASTHYIRTPSIKACLISGMIGAVFAYLMNRIALRRIRRLNLTDVNAN